MTKMLARAGMLWAALVMGCAGSATQAPTALSVPGRTGPREPSVQGLVGKPGPRYDVPTCPLRYEIHTRESSEGHMGMSLETFMTLDAEGGRRRMTLTPVPTAWLKMGKHRPYAAPDPGFSPVDLVTDGRTWSEADGKRAFLMHAMGTQGGLAILFPPLPEVVPSTTEWRLEREPWTVFQGGLTFHTSQAVKMWTPAQPLALTFHVEAAPDAGGGAVLRSSAHEDERTEQPGGEIMGRPLPGVAVKVTGDTRTEHVVTAKGRLLRATVDRDVVVETTYGTDAPQTTRFVRHTDARLVAACDGPTEAKIALAVTREEAAIDAIGQLGVAVYKDERDKALAWFAPALRKKHGDARLWDTIQKYRQARGNMAWPIPVMLDDDRVKILDAQRVEVGGRSNVPKPGSTNTVTPVTLRFVVRTDAAGPVVERITGAFDIEKGDVFEASDTRLFP